MTDAAEAASPAIPAATVVLVRGTATTGARGADAAPRVEGRLRRDVGVPRRPGRRRRPPSRATTRPAAARRAAAREALEECGLAVDPDDLVPFSHWVPPPITPRRFSTHFFLARASDGEVVVDGGEIHEHEWLAAREVLDRRDRGEVDLAPPTWVTLHDLAEHDTVDAALASGRRARPGPPLRDPLGHDRRRGGGDVGTATAATRRNDPDQPGARHRLWMLEDGWRLERSS